MFVEQTLTARIGDAGKRLHTGRSRNDQVAVDLRLYLRDEIDDAFRRNIRDLIAGHLRPGRGASRTTSCPATPICSGPSRSPSATISWPTPEMLLRDLSRLQDCQRADERQCPLGSGALAGTTYPIDRLHDRPGAGL